MALEFDLLGFPLRVAAPVSQINPDLLLDDHGVLCGLEEGILEVNSLVHNLREVLLYRVFQLDYVHLHLTLETSTCEGLVLTIGALLVRGSLHNQGWRHSSFRDGRAITILERWVFCYEPLGVIQGSPPWILLIFWRILGYLLVKLLEEVPLVLGILSLA